MEHHLYNKWGLLATNGVIAILFGVMALFIPGPTLLTLVTYFGVVILLLGLSSFVGVILNIRNRLPYLFDLLESLVIIGIGILLTFYTRKSLEVFVIIIGSWAILLGIGQLYLAIKISPELNSKNALFINGGISLIFGLILYFNPFQSAKFFLVLSGLLALAIGLILIILALKLKNFSGSEEG
ncbi:MAG: hypothetical protein GWP10_17435 [Nitrospiraceae bacterium]|nr:hypothetical protein [Nitrospiraceae bacterium]